MYWVWPESILLVGMNMKLTWELKSVVIVGEDSVVGVLDGGVLGEGEGGGAVGDGE
jgi:hypothetical protein